MFKKFIAEFVGTFALVLCGTGSIIVDEITDGGTGILGIAFAFGFIIIAMIYAIGHISGAHINPAVTISLAISKRIPSSHILLYFTAQIGGAIIASALLHVIYPLNEYLGATLPSGSITQSFVLEFITTFLMMFVIIALASQKDKRFDQSAGMIIGFTVIGLIFVAGPISGGSFNPARSIGPAIISGHLEHLWLYIVAPISGAITSVILFDWLRIKSE